MGCRAPRCEPLMCLGGGLRLQDCAEDHPVVENTIWLILNKSRGENSSSPYWRKLADCSPSSVTCHLVHRAVQPSCATGKCLSHGGQKICDRSSPWPDWRAKLRQKSVSHLTCQPLFASSTFPQFSCPKGGSAVGHADADILCLTNGASVLRQFSWHEVCSRCGA